VTTPVENVMDHVNNKEERGLTRQAAVAVDTTTARKGPPPIPTRSSSTALTDKEQQQMKGVAQQGGVAAPQNAPANMTTATKVPPKVAKKPKGAKRQSPQPQPPTGRGSSYKLPILLTIVGSEYNEHDIVEGLDDDFTSDLDMALQGFSGKEPELEEDTTEFDQLK